MSANHKNVKSKSRTSKRERFVAEKGSRRTSPAILFGGILLALALVAGTAYALGRASPEEVADDSAPVRAATSGHEPYPLAVAEDGAIRLAAATFDDYEAHYYTYMHDGDPIEFFVLKSKDGVVRAAFNACDVCFGSKKGYTQDGDEMICNNCGRRFPADRINVEEGGCNPSPLEREMVGDTLVIQVADIISGQRYF